MENEVELINLPEVVLPPRLVAIAQPANPYTRASITSAEIQTLPTFGGDLRDLHLFVTQIERIDLLIA